MSKGVLIAATAATLFLDGAVQARAAEKAGGDKVKCYGINECKGRGSCASVSNSCAGKNECKGKGFLNMSKVECEQKGGKVVN
jgi:uncharacterized membrane protein